jgi:hypothetical protein
MMGFSRFSTVITFISFLYLHLLVVTTQPDKRTAIGSISVKDHSARDEFQLEVRGCVWEMVDRANMLLRMFP